jgi:hypothetical protein
VALAAGPGPDALELKQQANAAVSEGLALDKGGVASQEAAARLRDAGELFAKAAKLLPEIPENRQDRGDLLDQAVSAFGESYRIWSKNPAPLERALTMAERHIKELVRRYGEPEATVMVEWTAAHAHAEALRLQLAEHRAAHPEPVKPPEPEPERPVVAVPVAPVPVLGPKPPGPVAPVPKPLEGQPDWRRVGLGVSAGLLGVSVAAVLGTSLQIARTPFKGRLYREIEAAAEANGLPHSIEDDMCVGPGRNVSALASACDARDRHARAAVGMTVVSGVLAVTTVAFAVLLARGKAPRVAALRRHAAGVAVAPQRRGALLTLGARF